MIDDQTLIAIFVSSVVSAVLSRYMPRQSKNIFKDIGRAMLIGLFILAVVMIGLLLLQFLGQSIKL